MPSHQQHLGKRGESKARRYLINKGFRPKDQNWYCRYGELDLIMWDGDELVFIEVKYRSDHHYGRPEEMVSPSKSRRLLKTADRYLVAKSLHDIFWRFDIVAITGGTPSESISHFTDVIRDA